MRVAIIADLALPIPLRTDVVLRPRAPKKTLKARIWSGREAVAYGFEISDKTSAGKIRAPKRNGLLTASDSLTTVLKSLEIAVLDPVAHCSDTVGRRAEATDPVIPIKMEEIRKARL